MTTLFAHAATLPPTTPPRPAAEDHASSPGTWRLERAAFGALEGCATLTEHWLQVDFALDLPAPISAEAIWQLLALSGIWPGVKFCALQTGGEIVPLLRGEMALTDDAQRRPRLEQLHQDLAAAWEACQLGTQTPPANTGEALEVERLRELCLEGQWPAVIGEERAGGGEEGADGEARGAARVLSVTLDAGRFPCRARFAAAGAAMVLWAPWAAPESQPGSPADRALGAYLLAASAALRQTALAADTSAGRRAVVARTALPRNATAAQVAHALAALSVAARHCGPEVALLQEDPELAQAWLSGWSAVASRAG